MQKSKSNIPCSPKCKIVGQILLDHPLCYALTATPDVPAVYLQQFWKTDGKVPNTKDTIIFKLDIQEIVYTVDMFRATLKFQVETPDNPFVSPVTIDIIESFMNRVGYQGVVDKVSAFYTKLLAQPWQTIIEPESHKKHPEEVSHDDEKKEEEKDEKKDDEMDSLENMTENMQTPIPTPPRSPRINLSSDRNIDQELMDIVSPSTAIPSQDQHKQRRISNRATDDLTESNLKPMVANTIMEDRDAFQAEVPALISQEFKAHAPKIIEELFKQYVQNNVLKSMFEKSSTSNTSCRDDAFHSQHHDGHQDNDAPPEGEKRVKRHTTIKRSKSAKGSSSKQSAKESITYVSKQQQQQQEWDAWVEETIIDEDEVIPEDEKPELITELQNVDKHIPTIFDRARMEATLNNMLSNQFRNTKEYAYHVEQATNFMKNQIVWESRQEDIRRPVPKPLVFFGPQRNPNKPPRENDKPASFSEADFKYLNKDDIEDLYYLCRSKKVNYRETKLMNSLITFNKSYVIWERVHDFQLGIKSYQIKVNLTAPTLTFPGIKEHESYSIVDKPTTGLIYLNSKNEKRVMYLVEIIKFCDATLEKVLKEVKLRIFQTEFLKKPPLLGELYLDIMKAYER
ncbi:hypothetical protein Tco_1021396 [Tanacetum coccineum]